MAAAAPASKGLAIITGASSGIGLATARAFSEAGYSLLLLARRLAKMEELSLPNTTCVACDVTDAAAVTAAVAAGEEAHGPTQVMVNCAGLMQLGDVNKQDPAEWRRMVDVNVFGVLNGIRAVVDGMKERKAGTIINISSIAGIKVFPSHAVYCATKFGVHALTETLRKECAADGVRVSLVSPGVTQTELLGHTTDPAIVEGYEGWKSGELKGKPMTPEDVAASILHVASAPAHVCIRDVQLAPVFQVE